MKLNSLSLSAVVLVGMLSSEAASQEVVGTATVLQERRFSNLEDCESGTVVPYGGSFSSDINDGIFKRGNFRVNCNTNALEIDDNLDGEVDRSIPLPACEPEHPDQSSVSEYDCVQESDFDAPFFSQKRYQDEGCPLFGSSYNPILGLTEECLDRPKTTLSAPFGAIKASCRDVPGKLVIHHWLADKECGGDPDLTEEFELDGECQRHIETTEIRHVLSACQAEVGAKAFSGASTLSNMALVTSMMVAAMTLWE